MIDIELSDVAHVARDDDHRYAEGHMRPSGRYSRGSGCAMPRSNDLFEGTQQINLLIIARRILR